MSIIESLLRAEKRLGISRGYLGLTVGEKTFTGLDFAEDVSLLANMLEIVVLALEILHEESPQLSVETSWTKTKIPALDTHKPFTKVSVLGHDVEVVDSSIIDRALREMEEARPIYSGASK